MNLTLVRRWFTEKSTIGDLSIDGAPECFVLEDVVRAPGAPKVFGQTAIPAGRYEVSITYSPRFKIDMPLLLEVPGFQGVRIHPGNKPEDTEGCLLVGELRGTDEVLHSRVAYAQLFLKLQLAEAKGETIHITITEEHPSPGVSNA